MKHENVLQIEVALYFMPLLSKHTVLKSLLQYFKLCSEVLTKLVVRTTPTTETKTTITETTTHTTIKTITTTNLSY